MSQTNKLALTCQMTNSLQRQDSYISTCRSSQFCCKRLTLTSSKHHLATQYQHNFRTAAGTFLYLWRQCCGDLSALWRLQEDKLRNSEKVEGRDNVNVCFANLPPSTGTLQEVDPLRLYVLTSINTENCHDRKVDGIIPGSHLTSGPVRSHQP